MDLNKEFVIGVDAHIGKASYPTIITCRQHTITADEPEAKGGADTGPDPFELLLSSLGSCTAITLRMYINRKMWAIDGITVKLELYKINGGTLIERHLSFSGEVNDEQSKRLVQIADACPVHKILVGNVMINTNVV